MGYSDKILNCVNCRKTFIFSTEEQEYHASRGFPNVPTRCPTCRQAKKAGAIKYEEANADDNPHNR